MQHRALFLLVLLQLLAYGRVRQPLAAKVCQPLIDDASCIDLLFDSADEKLFAYLPASAPITPIENTFYFHGGGMGAAIALLHDSNWRFVLKLLMPDVYSDVLEVLMRRTSPTGVSKAKSLIVMFENNPVVAAFAFVRTFARIGKIDRRPIEWDLFLPPTLKLNRTHFAPVPSGEELRTFFESGYIAHGSAASNVLEMLGMPQYKHLRKLKKTAFGGVTIPEWMAIYGKSLLIHRMRNRRTSIDSAEETVSEETGFSSMTLHDVIMTSQTHMSIERAIEEHRQSFANASFRAVIDLKSRHIGPERLLAVLREARSRGIRVVALGSLIPADIDGVVRRLNEDLNQKKEEKKEKEKNTTFSSSSSLLQNDGNEQHEEEEEEEEEDRVLELKFYHYAGDLQKAALKGMVRQRDAVLFNGGSLIRYKKVATSEAKMSSYRLDFEVLRQLFVYKQTFNLSLGFYVQEFDIDVRAMNLLVSLANTGNVPTLADQIPDMENHTTGDEKTLLFNLGFAWGGLADSHTHDIRPLWYDGTTGTATQGLIGSAWDIQKPPPVSSKPEEQLATTTTASTTSSP